MGAFLKYEWMSIQVLRRLYHDLRQPMCIMTSSSSPKPQLPTKSQNFTNFNTRSVVLALFLLCFSIKMQLNSGHTNDFWLVQVQNLHTAFIPRLHV